MRWTWALAITAAAAGAALAQPAPPAAPPVTEIPGPTAKHEPPPGGYTQLFLSPCGEPWRSGRNDPYPVVLWFKATDTNHDGAIDLAEFRADHLGFFDALDRDGNGVLEGAEISYYEQHIAPDVLLGRPFGALDGRLPGERLPGGLWGGEIIKAQEGNYGRGQVYSPDGATGPAPDLGAKRRNREPLVGAGAFGFFPNSEPLMATDSNLDGRISRLEFQEAADRRFKALDRKADGKLTLDELPRTRAQIEGVGRGKG